MLSPSVFKAYDVRGIVPDELDADGAERLAAAYVAAFEPEVMAIGHDMRLSSPDIAAAAIAGAAKAGRGRGRPGRRSAPRCSTSPSASTATTAASRSPHRTTRPPYNGMKIVRRGAQPVGGDTGLDKIKALALGELPALVAGPGTRHLARRLPGFVDRVMQVHRPGRDRAARRRAGRRQRHGRPDDHARCSTGCRCGTHTYSLDPDGAFPNHEPNPLLEENRQFIIAKVLEHGADLGHRLGRRRRPLLLHRRHRASSCPAT